MEVIKVENLNKEFILRDTKYLTLKDSLKNIFKPKKRTFTALKDVNFSVEEGDIVGVIGHNGAGKSTLLKIISQITQPNSGEITLNGKVSSLLEVGTGFHPELTGRENIYLNGSILGMSKKEVSGKIDDIISFSGVSNFVDIPVKKYSSGMYVRLAFAVAAFLDSDILIIDEVLSVGDAEFQKKCLGKIDNIVSEKNRTVIFVSHNMSAINSLCNKCILLKEGELVMYGPTREVVQEYLSDGLAGKDSDIISQDKHIKGSGEALIEKMRFADAKGKSKNDFSIGEKFFLELDVATKNNKTNASFFYVIHDYEGGEIFSSFQKDCEDSFFELSHKKTIRVEMKDYFLPGNYYISAGIFDERNNFFDWVKFGSYFRVQKNSIDGSVFDNRLGLVSEKSKWEIL